MPKDTRTRKVPYSKLRYNAKAARYILPNGRFLSPESVRGIVDRDIEAVKGRMQNIGFRLQSGEISVSEFRDRMAVEVKSLHLAQLAAGRGGFHNLTQSDFGRVGQAIREQYGYLNAWAERMNEKPELIQDGVAGQVPFMERCSMYSEAGRATYEAAKLQSDQEAGYQSEINILENTAHHCRGANSCIEQTDKGAVSIGTLLLPGRRKCKTQCKCIIKRLKKAA